MENHDLAKTILVVCIVAMLMVAISVSMFSGDYQLLNTVMKFVEIPLAFLIGHYFGGPSNIIHNEKKKSHFRLIRTQYEQRILQELNTLSEEALPKVAA